MNQEISLLNEHYHLYFHEPSQTFAVHTWETALEVIKQKDIIALGTQVLSGHTKAYLTLFVNYFDLLINGGQRFTVELIYKHVDSLVLRMFNNITISK